ncbi:DUF2497 domain-containing protein [Sphingomonas nostoxanthinifaciens]|uniref:DUF2497 domain-containing protein n=1 Tax=Sphingomonas nostoxanthinifaciens TaxID=2872652 RepID=UPI001CC20AF3|nr:DUF2497 domain-containing protein [Sphingomonas nostoxanthinifaciens]UAK23628.1 DUF2497 domain-containing protein [Sphingomonas nostoxanthinifaciens]
MSDGTPDQSMEAILASIKRVINAEVPAAGRRPAAIEPTPDEDVLELGDVPASEATAAEPGEDLLSGASVEASKAALAQLAAIRVDPRADEHTLDGLVREMLRPMLKAWLDANLPELVERIVAREVARVVGR